jgi:hypothetical protein
MVDLIAMGICKDSVIEDYLSTLSRGARPEERHFAARQIADIALTSDDMNAVARALKALKSLLPLDPGLENALDKRLLALTDRGMMAENAGLAEAIALFIYSRSQARASAARPYIPTLLSFLAQNVETTGAYSYYTLMIVANNAPVYLGPYADPLIRTLNSPSYAAQTFAMRIIAALAPSHPEYVAGAREVLHDLSETSPQEIIKAEAAKAYRAVRDIPKAPRGHGCRLLDDPAIASLYETPVWQRAVGCHLSTAYSNDSFADRPQGRRSGTKRDSRPSKRSNLYQEFVEKLKQGESNQSFEDQLALLAPESIAQAVPSEIMPVEAITPSAPVVIASPAVDNLPDSATANLQEMMNEVQSDFSTRAGGLLDALGMGHLKRGNAFKAEPGNHKISAKEFVSAMEKLVRDQKSKAM